MEDQIIDTATDIIQPVWEGAMILAGEYSKKCGRSVLTGEDLIYAFKYCARNMVGKHMGTMFPELEEESDDDEEEDLETVDESEEPFTRYSGDDKLMNDVNEAVDTWDDWVPRSPIESMLKDAVNKNQ